MLLPLLLFPPRHSGMDETPAPIIRHPVGTAEVRAPRSAVCTRAKRRWGNKINARLRGRPKGQRLKTIVLYTKRRFGCGREALDDNLTGRVWGRRARRNVYVRTKGERFSYSATSINQSPRDFRCISDGRPVLFPWLISPCPGRFLLPLASAAAAAVTPFFSLITALLSSPPRAPPRPYNY